MVNLGGTVGYIQSEYWVTFKLCKIATKTTQDTLHKGIIINTGNVKDYVVQYVKPGSIKLSA